MSRGCVGEATPLSHLLMVLQAPRARNRSSERRLQDVIDAYLECSQSFPIEDRPIWVLPEGRHGHV